MIKKIKKEKFPYNLKTGMIITYKNEEYNKKCSRLKISEIFAEDNIIIFKKDNFKKNIRENEEGKLILARLNGLYIYPVKLLNKKEGEYIFKVHRAIEEKKARKEIRLIFNDNIKYSLPDRNLKGDKFKGTIKDISTNGVKLITNKKISIKENLLLHINNKKMLLENLSGKVVRKKKVFNYDNKKYISNNYFEYGIKIDDTEAKKDKISKFLMDRQIQLRKNGFL